MKMFKGKQNFWDWWHIAWPDLYDLLIDWQKNLLIKQKSYQKKDYESMKEYNLRLHEATKNLVNKMIIYEWESITNSNQSDWE